MEATKGRIQLSSYLPTVSSVLKALYTANGNKIPTVAELYADKQIGKDFESPAKFATWLATCVESRKTSKNNGDSFHRNAIKILDALKANSPADLFVVKGGKAARESQVEADLADIFASDEE